MCTKFSKRGGKKNGKSPNGLVNERILSILSSIPAFAVRSNYEYPNSIIYSITEIWSYEYSYKVAMQPRKFGEVREFDIWPKSQVVFAFYPVF